jgi:hypothetical protein
MSCLQRNGSHVIDAGDTQFPFPSQVLSAMNRFDATSHDDGLQTVWISYLRQKPFPSHVPSRPQVLVASGPHEG